MAGVIDNVHALNELRKWMNGDFEVGSALLLFGMWGAHHELCGDKGTKAHNILLNGFDNPVLKPLMSLQYLRSLRLPSVPTAPAAHIAFPTVSIAQHASGNNVNGSGVPLSIRWLQWGDVKAVELSVLEDGAAWFNYPNIRTAATGGLLHLTPVARLFPPGHNYQVCISITDSFQRTASVCSRSFFVSTAPAGSAFNSDLTHGVEASYTYSSPQLGVVGFSGQAAFTVDTSHFGQQGCRFLQMCVAFTTPFLGTTGHTLSMDGVGSTPLTIDYFIYLSMS